jgi:general stress protein YciG
MGATAITVTPMEGHNMHTQKIIQGSSKHGKGSASPRGFAAMDPERLREIASNGGRAAHEQGTAHEFNSDEAREAGRKGGQAVAQRRRDRWSLSNSGSSSGRSR